MDKLKSDRFSTPHGNWNVPMAENISTGTTEIRMLFAFDPLREAIFLITGDKSGQWRKWYETAIPIADQRFEEHIQNLKEEQ
ncbi:MAG TPA: type II toxin-antitoxin system RelE/ParE family toxin [Candidatus Limnocylindrales bacterium]|nr:type II toxin-antitoxin system RelE/ParE family toxin [Candidatus Limnocylindrales bacterium]